MLLRPILILVQANKTIPFTYILVLIQLIVEADCAQHCECAKPLFVDIERLSDAFLLVCASPFDQIRVPFQPSNASSDRSKAQHDRSVGGNFRKKPQKSQDWTQVFNVELLCCAAHELDEMRVVVGDGPLESFDAAVRMRMKLEESASRRQ